MLKTLFKIIGVLAILHLLLFGAGLGYLISSGKLTAERAREIKEILDGQTVETAEADADEDTEEEVASSSEAAIAAEQVEEEKQRREAARRRTEIQQQKNAINLVMTKFAEEKEMFRQQIAEQKAQIQKETVQELSEEFKKKLEYLETLPSDQAAELLIHNNTEEDAARILVELDTRKGTKIITAAMANPVMKGRIAKIFKLIGEIAPDGSEWEQIASNQNAKNGS